MNALTFDGNVLSSESSTLLTLGRKKETQSSKKLISCCFANSRFIGK